MKSRSLKCVTAITLFAALATPLQLAPQHTRYKPVDLASGTCSHELTERLGLGRL
jgi:hypothetical protein